ncbi:MAG: adenylate/guanylate cyclase domain-containing protein [Candidatus Rifleibacteriota bacterium]
MKNTNSTKARLTAVVGLLVFSIPLIFVNYLSQKIFERSRETSVELLKEKIMQEVESFKSRLSPESYLKQVILKIHQELLPEMKPDLLKLYPEANFGDEIYTSSIPEKFVGALKDHGLSPLLFISSASGFSTLNFWYAAELNEVLGKDARMLALSMMVNLHEKATVIFYMNYQKRWISLLHPSRVLAEIHKAHPNHDAYFNRYISRFTDLKPDYDEVYKIYTDYFSRQYLYSYSIANMSPVNIHGGYTMIVRGDSINPVSIAESASTMAEQENILCAVEPEQKNKLNGFYEMTDGLTYIGNLPTTFVSHLNFWNDFYSNSGKKLSGNEKIRVFGHFPHEFFNQRQTYYLVRYCSIAIGFVLILAAFYASLFGFRLPVQIRKKLLLVIGALFLLPVAATGIVTYYLLSGFDRIVELHLKAQLENRLNKIMQMEDEKRAGLQTRLLETKMRLQNSDKPTEKVLNTLSLYENFPGIWNWITSLAVFESNGTFNVFNATGNNDKRLTEGLLGKYATNQGFLKASGQRNRELEMKISLTLGLLEGFLTPEIEEALSTKEGVLEREITHTVDTYMGCLYLCERKNGENAVVYAKSSNNETSFCDYLISLNLEKPGSFRENSAYSDIKSGIRIRRYINYTNYGWPADTIFDVAMAGYFQKAVTQRSSGTKVIRNSDGLTIASWKFRDQQQVVMVAIGNARKTTEISLAIAMIFPVTAGYSFILLLSITGILSQLLLKPIEILKQAIEYINDNLFGIKIYEVEIAEFRKVTNAFNEMSVALKQKELIGRYVSDQVIESLEKHERTDQGSESVEVSILASDIRSFTTITETYPPLDVVDMLNSYFTAMEEAIVEENGVIDKFIGDAIQAVFYYKQGLDAPGLRATRAAVQMRSKLQIFNHERREKNLFTIENGIGIASGKVISGTIGSETGRKVFTITGAPVSASSALEASSIKSQSKIMACQQTVEMCKAEFSFSEINKDMFELKGNKVAG